MNHGHVPGNVPGTNGMPTIPHRPAMMTNHMTFFWGTRAEILFSGWPGTRTGMYALALVFVFALCLLIEWLSHSCLPVPAKPGFAAGVLRSLLHALRMGLAYLAMLALMSFNVGVFLAALTGHAVGFLAFAKSEEARPPPYEWKGAAYLPPMSC